MWREVRNRQIVVAAIAACSALTCFAEAHAQWVQTDFPDQTLISVFVLSGSDLVAAPSPLGLAHSTDNGDTWQSYPGLPQQEGLGPTSFARAGNVLMTVFEDFHVQSADSAGFYRSTSGGVTWSRQTVPESVILDPFVQLGTKFFAADRTQGFWTSPDSGSTWSIDSDDLDDGGLSRFFISRFDTAHGDLFVATRNGGIFRSTDSGSSWVSFDEGLYGSTAYGIASNNLYQFALLSDSLGLEVYRRKLSDRTWSPMYKNDDHFVQLASLAVHDNFVFVADDRGRIYGSSDAGASWETIEALPLSVGPVTTSYLTANDDFLFAGGRGVFRYPLSKFAGAELQLPGRFTLSQNFPNPFNPSTEISFSMPHAAFVTLRVTDVLGNTISVLLDEAMAEGEHSVRWDASGFPAGIYSYHLTAGNFSETRKMVVLK